MEYVVLVDDNNTPIGTAPKDSVHTRDTPLHRAFSLFLFNSQNQLLLTKRAKTKKAFPGVWTNSVCGHPGVNEAVSDAALRRLTQEVGISDAKVREVAPYRYRFADVNGIVENEICPILIGFTENQPRPDAMEIDEWKWIDWDEFMMDIVKRPEIYSPWCKEEAIILQHSDLGLR